MFSYEQTDNRHKTTELQATQPNPLGFLLAELGTTRCARGGTEQVTAKAAAVLSAAAAGVLAPGQAAQLISALGTIAKIGEIDELASRVAALEEKQHAKP